LSNSILVALLLFRGRHLLHPPGSPPPRFSLGPVLGPVTNIVGLGFAVFTTVFFLFPPEYPATPSNMNYAIAVFGIVAIVSVVTWLVDGQKNFSGPKDIEGLLELARRSETKELLKERHNTRTLAVTRDAAEVEKGQVVHKGQEL
jgi:choline transport protein